ncbi:MAG TPA: glycosyltransferase family 4 protein [Bryobacteraceae bacterium]|nr:glycosyltransferase family 4 protein [Bryobacteraceae bacterium]
MNILISFPTSPLTDWQPSGDGLNGYRMIVEVAKLGHVVHVATRYADLRHPLPPNVVVHQMQKRAEHVEPGKFAYMLWTRRLLAELRTSVQFDLIHELNPVFSAISLAFAGSGIPVVLGPHFSRWPADANGKRAPLQQVRQRVAQALKDLFMREQHRRASAILLSTQAALNNVQHPERHLGRLFLLPPGVDAEKFTPRPEPEGEPPTVLFFANVWIRKGVFTLLDAFERTSKLIPQARLIIAGDGSNLEAVKQQVEASSYCDRVAFLGRVSRADVPDVLARCSVYCLPSYGEPFGITAIEAMACGKPLVVTNAGGLAYLVSEEGGRQVPVRNAPALAEALVELLQDAELRRKMGEYNRRQVETQYAWPRVVRRLDAIYQQVVKSSSSPSPDLLEAHDIAEYQRRQSAEIQSADKYWPSLGGARLAERT